MTTVVWAEAQPTCRQPGGATPVLLVHGMGRSQRDFPEGSALRDHIASIRGTFVDTFDYEPANREWVTDHRIGQALADQIACLGDASAAANGTGRVVVVAHSMGGLATRQATSLRSGGRAVSDRLGLVVTIGTPHKGSWLEGALTLGTTGETSGWIFKLVTDALHAECTETIGLPQVLWGVCDILKDPTSEAALGMRPGSQELNELPALPSGPVYAIAGQVHVVADLFGREVRLPPDIGDILVRPDSANQLAAEPAAGGGSLVRECDIKVSALIAKLGWNSCTHGGLLSDPEVVNAVGRSIQKWISTRPLGPSSRVDIAGVGPVRVGMTVAEAERATGAALAVQAFEAFGRQCYHVTPGGLNGLAFMVQARPGERLTDYRQGRIVRAEVSRTPYETLSGIRVGSTEDDVRRAYPDLLESQPHEYVRGGQYLTLKPRDASDQAYGVRFVIELGRVAQILAGERAAIQLVEGCA